MLERNVSMDKEMSFATEEKYLAICFLQIPSEELMEAPSWEAEIDKPLEPGYSNRS